MGNKSKYTGYVTRNSRSKAAKNSEKNNTEDEQNAALDGTLFPDDTPIDTTPEHLLKTPVQKNHSKNSNDNSSNTTPDKAIKPRTDESNTTLASSEKPPEPTPSFLSALTQNLEKKMDDPVHLSTFTIQKQLSEKGTEDDSSVGTQPSSGNATFTNSVRMTMMFRTPRAEEGGSDDDAPIVAIQKMNEMIKALTNKLPCKIGPWLTSNMPSGRICERDLLSELPEDLDVVEARVYDFNRFFPAGKTGYVRMNIFYTDGTTEAEICATTSQFKKPWERFFDKAHSEAASPINIGCLTGSVSAMATSRDFHNVFKTKFKLSELGLWFTLPRGDKSSTFDKAKFVLHIEIDRNDLPRRKVIEEYFNSPNNTIANTFFGNPMMLTKQFDYFDDEGKRTLENHARKQTSLGKSLRSIVVYGTQINNWANSQKSSTLFNKLMKVESITTKKVVKGSKTSTFKGQHYTPSSLTAQVDRLRFILLEQTAKKVEVLLEPSLFL